MSTIQTKNSFIRVKKFIEKGGALFDDTYDNNIIKMYYDYLIEIGNKTDTIVSKLRVIYLLKTFLTSLNKTLQTFTKENIYDYLEECSKLSWCLPYQDKNKMYVKLLIVFKFVGTVI